MCYTKLTIVDVLRSIRVKMSSLPVVAFVCTHNACRSQIAEAVARTWAGDALSPCSAGTHPAKRINPDALRVLRDRFGIDASSQKPKPLDELPRVDVLVTMGCGVSCPALPARYREDWGLEDPTGNGDEAFLATADMIVGRTLDLKERMQAGCLAGSVELTRQLAARRLKALADPTRLHVIQLLSQQGELCACRLLPHLGVGQPTLSHHMTLLCREGLVIPRKEGRWTHYRLNRYAFAALRDMLPACLPD